jgi:uncharacterized protein
MLAESSAFLNNNLDGKSWGWKFLNWALFFLTVISLASIMTLITTTIVAANISNDNITDFERSRVSDSASVLREADTSILLKKIDAILESYSFDTVIVTTETLDGKTAQAYADDFFDQGGYGYGPTSDGILLLVAMKEREWHISTTGTGISFFSDRQINSISDHLLPYFKDGDYASGFTVFLDEVSYVLGHVTDDVYVPPKNIPNEYTPHANIQVKKELDKPQLFLYILLGSIAVALICVLIMKYQMNTARPQPLAHDYVKSGSFKVTRQKDIFLYSYTSRRLKPQDTSHTGSSSSTHSSSSGHTHGGGGGKF